MISPLGRLGTLRAMAALCRARLLVAFVPFRRWRTSLGRTVRLGPAQRDVANAVAEGQRLARQVERAAHRLPFGATCLPRAMALSWMLGRNNIAHSLVFAVRPPGVREGPDALHAWVEIGGIKVIGDLPGPWIETLRLGS